MPRDSVEENGKSRGISRQHYFFIRLIRLYLWRDGGMGSFQIWNREKFKNRAFLWFPARFIKT